MIKVSSIYRKRARFDHNFRERKDKRRTTILFVNTKKKERERDKKLQRLINPGVKVAKHLSPPLLPPRVTRAVGGLSGWQVSFSKPPISRGPTGWRDSASLTDVSA